MTKAQQAFYRKYERTIMEDVMKAAKEHRTGDIYLLFMDYGWFLERHPDALEAVA